jgi:hypothetical protein
MYQRIDETIIVAGVYRPGKFIPKRFQWKQHTFDITTINTSHDFRDGNVRKRQFSVSVGENVYLIEFNRDQETWTLEQLWVEG